MSRLTLLVLAINAGVLAVYVVAMLKFAKRMEGWRRFTTPGLIQVELESGSYTLYQERETDVRKRFARPSLWWPKVRLLRRGSTADVQGATMPIVVIGPGGRHVQVRPLSGRLFYRAIGGREGVALATFMAQRAGTYEISSQSLRARLAVGRTETAPFLVVVRLGGGLADVHKVPRGVVIVTPITGRRRLTWSEVFDPEPSRRPDPGFEPWNRSQAPPSHVPPPSRSPRDAASSRRP